VVFQKNFGEESAENVTAQFQSLLKEEESPELDRIYQILRNEPVKRWGDLLSRFPEYMPQQLEKIDRMEKILGTVALYGMNLPKSSLCAFDLARAANLAAVGCGLGYIPRADAQQMLEQVSARAQEIYSGWSDYFAGYTIGRGLWAWKAGRYVLMDAPAVRNVCRVLLFSPESPYRGLRFDGSREG
jgi:hypothetical protein